MLNMILTILLILVSLASVAGLALVAANPAYAREVKAISKRHIIGGAPVGCLLALLSLSALAMWTWYAIDQSEWRYAAIAWVPVLCHWLGKAAIWQPKQSAQPARRDWP